ncbi:MAG: choice-of-anchor Q domain-containing protein, partial [Methyloceanibacter sp.]
AFRDHPHLGCHGSTQPLQLNSPGNTPTMAILPTSPAVNKADSGSSLKTDQRGVTRPQVGG